MKKILLGAALVAAGAAMAADSTQFAVMKVPSSEAETIVSVPWLESSTGTSSVTVSNLVLTSGLNEGDMLKWYNSSTGKYQCWTLANKVWQEVVNVGTSGTDSSGSASTTTIDRGQAIILTRGAPIASCFYIMGKPYSGAETAVTLAGGSATNSVYSLVAPPSVAAVDVNTGITWEGITKYDGLILADGTSLVWSNGNWYKYESDDKKWTSEDITIAAGTGAWFIGKSSDPKKAKSFVLK